MRVSLAVKPFPYPNFKPKRLPERKRMTAILGMNYLDGVLLMADTEEFLGGDAKSECDKLYRFTFPIGMKAGTVITGGSGDSHLIECANQEMHQLFAMGKMKIADVAPKPDEILAALNIFADNFFQETTAQYRGLPHVPTNRDVDSG
jgi:hypothetical protein